MKQYIDRSGAWFSRFSFNQKVLLAALLTAGVISLIIFTTWLQQDEKTVLFTNLSPEDAAHALEELTKQNIDADLSNGGTTILVPQAEVHRLRVELAAKGIPSSGTVGFEIFDGKQYGLTEFLQDVNFKRALEGELTKSITTLNGIQSARVHLVIPKPSIFKTLKSAATASVVVSLSRMARLDEAQIYGIQALVAGSVEGLTVENVTVIDQRGTVLSRHYESDAVGRSEGQLALKKEVEIYLTQKAESMLAQVMGEDKAIVRVDATLNFERLERSREAYDPNNTVVRSEEREESAEPQSGATSENSVTNYEINKTVENIIGEVGGIKNLSVAVFVDGRYDTPAGGGDAVYTPLSDDELAQIRRIVQTAVGLNSQRGDQIEVVNMQFQSRELPPAQAPGLLGHPWLERGPELVGKLLLFGVAAVMLLTLRRNLGRLMSEGSPTPRRLAASVEAELEEQPMPSIKSASGTHSSAEKMVSEVKEYAGNNPEQMAELIHAWITDSE